MGSMLRLGLNPKEVKELRRELKWPTLTATGGRSARQQLLYLKLVDAGRTTVEQVEEMSGGNLFPPSHVKMDSAFVRPDLQGGSGKRRKGYGMSPAWAECLMGFPAGWTGSKPLATPRFRRWLRLHSCSSRKG